MKTLFLTLLLAGSFGAAAGEPVLKCELGDTAGPDVVWRKNFKAKFNTAGDGVAQIEALSFDKKFTFVVRAYEKEISVMAQEKGSKSYMGANSDHAKVRLDVFAGNIKKIELGGRYLFMDCSITPAL